MTRIVTRNRYIAGTVLILGGFFAAANAESNSMSRGPVPTVTPTPASYWGENASFSASGDYLLVESDTYNDYYVQRTSSGVYQWSYSKSGSWSNIPSQYISSTLSSQLAGYFDGGADDPPTTPTPPPTTPTPPPTTPTPPPTTPTPPAASVPTVTPTPASYWGVNAKFWASGQYYLLVTSDTYDDYYVRSTSTGGYQWSYSKSGSWSNIPSQYISSALSSQLAGYFGGASSPVPPDLLPNFSGVTVSAQTWVTNRAITAFTVPAAASGDAPLTYAAAGLPAGVSMSSMRTVSGTPTATGSGTATVTARDADGDTASLSFSWTVASSAPAGLAAPGPLTGPDTDSDGAFAIAWGRSAGATRYELQQSRDGGAWTDTSVTGTPTTKAFTVTESGEYQYRIRACDATRCSNWSAIKMVVVILPPTVGFDSTYVVRSGHLGPDRDTDIYLSPLAVGTGNIGEFILKNEGGTFTLQNNPSVGELASAQSWGVSTSLEIVLEDVNVDGVWDAFVTGISGTTGFGGAVDQVVVSPATASGKPTGLVAVDSNLKSFVDSVMAWYEDLTHFDTDVVTQISIIDGTTSLQGERNTHLSDCQDDWVSCSEWRGKLTDYYGSTAACVIALASAGIIPRTPQGHRAPRAIVCDSIGWAYFGVVQVGATVKSFDSVAEGAKEDVADFVHIWEAGETRYQVENLADVLEHVLDITISGVLGDRIDEIQQSLFNLYALFGAQGRGSVDIPANKVIVTKRRVSGLGWAIINKNFHAVLEMPLGETYGSPAFNPTIAAYNESGILVARRNDPSERNNLFAGTVTVGPANYFTVWTALAASDRNYRSCPPHLDYRYPTELLATDEYNSNGYIAGIINSVNGVTNAPIASYLFGSNPVPGLEFQSCE